MDAGFLETTKKFFLEDTDEIIGAYFDGTKIFVARLTENFEPVEVDADSSEIEQLAEKIAQVCRQQDWQTSAVGFCLQENDAVTFHTPADNVPEKEIPAMVKSWAAAQGGMDAAFSFEQIGDELWMETIPRARLKEICAAFEKFSLELRALSVMPVVDALEKIQPVERLKFIANILREKKSPNLLATRSAIAWGKIFRLVTVLLIISLIFFSAKLFRDWYVASARLNAAQKAVEELRDDIALKKIIDADAAELNRLNKICAAQNVTPQKFNFLLNLGKVAGGAVHLTRIRCDENFFELEGKGSTPDAVKSYLSRVKKSVIHDARLERSAEDDDGEIIFSIRATLSKK